MVTLLRREAVPCKLRGKAVFKRRIDEKPLFADGFFLLPRVAKEVDKEYRYVSARFGGIYIYVKLQRSYARLERLHIAVHTLYQRNDIQYFFELDIDCLVGYDKVKEYRKRIECQTQKQAIPVWHKSRGIEEFKNLCAEYSYIAIGGFAIKDIKPAEYKYIHSLLSYARAHNTKVHGLGFTPADVEKYDFYSVDSSSWTIGSRYARIYLFKDGRMTQVGRPANTRLKDYKVLDAHNLKQWIRFQRYLDR